MNGTVSGTALAPAVDGKDQVLKDGDSFCGVSQTGDIEGDRSEGVYHHNSRYLSTYRASLGGLPLLSLSCQVLPGQESLVTHLVNAKTPNLPQGALHALRTLSLQDGTLTDRWEWTNFTDNEASSDFQLLFDSDFQDIFEIRNWLEPLPRKVTSSLLPPDKLELRYQGADEVTRSLRVVFPVSLQGERGGHCRLFTKLSLAPRETHSFEIRFDFLRGSDKVAFRRHPDWTDETTVVTSNAQVNRWMDQSLKDLRMLVTHTETGPYPYAGTPWFSAIFGRDALVTALRSLWLWPKLSKGVLRTLSAHQATSDEPAIASEKGKILHEMRLSERASLGDVPFGRYYGAVDSTPLFLILVGAYYTRTGDETLVDELWPSVKSATDWLFSRSNLNEHGFLTYDSQEGGLLHQGWRDADDALFHRDGEDVRGEIALVEVQGYFYRALKETARLAKHRNDRSLAKSCEERAAALREAIELKFWDEESQYYAMALDPTGRPCLVRSSAPGHCLWMGVVNSERATQVARALASKEFWSGWGLRTVAQGEARYNPVSYHNGSVWPHDTAICAEGLSRYGFRDTATRIFKALFQASGEFESRRLPELFCGFQRNPLHGGAVRYPGACSPQAWASVVPYSLLCSVLGLRIQGTPAKITLTHPKFPIDLEWVRINNLCVGDSRITFEVHYHQGRTSLAVLKKQGDCELDLLI